MYWRKYEYKQAPLQPLRQKTIRCISIDSKVTFYFKDEFDEYVRHNPVQNITIHCTDGYSYGRQKVETVDGMRWFTPQL